MATISRTGIAGGGTISPAHITNIIDALDGSSSTTTVIASGSFSGSLTGHASSATSASYAITSTSASYAITATSASYAITATSASYAITATSASYAATASYVANVSSFPFTGSAIISGSLQITGSLNVSAGIATPQFTINAANTASAGQHLVLDLNLMAKSGGTGQFIIPSVIPSATPKTGTMYWDDANSVLYIYQSSGGGGWRGVLLS
jgi:hypothetical protein